MTSQVKTKQQKSAESFMLAGIEAVSQHGVDRISVSQVTEIANATRPTFYSYFGDISGLLAEIWLVYSDQWLTELCDFKFNLGDASKSDKKRWTTMTEILAVSHRVPAIYEVVEPTIKRWTQSFGGESELQRLKKFWLAATRIGMQITLPVDKGVSSASIGETLIRNTPDIPTVNVGSLRTAKIPAVSDPKISSETVESQLIQAAVEVIASAGAAAASMSRIARKARLSTGSAYPRFANSNELINSSFDAAVSRVVEENFSFVDLEGFGPEDFGLFVSAGLLPPRETWRNFRIEIHIEGRVNKELAKRLSRSLSATNSQVAKGLIKYGQPKITEQAIPYFIHCVGIGFAVLLNAGAPVDKLDQRLITVEFVKLFSSF